MKTSRYIKRLIFSLLCCLLPGSVFSDYPQINDLSKKDILFKQLQADIDSHYKSIHSGTLQPVLKIFQYTCLLQDDLLSLAARLNLPYETLATLNRLGSAAALTPGQELLIPNQAGIFLCTSPATDLEEIMAAYRAHKLDGALLITIRRQQEASLFYFFSGERFHPVERAFFLKILFRFPLENKGRLSSPFGSRANPFSGHQEFHSGIDIAAPQGTIVLAAREGVVKTAAYSPVYGNYIIISHPGNYSSVYGHLSKIDVTLDQKVFTGMSIGRVGTTGRSTGPHLHFEILKDGDPQDPASLLR